MLNFQYNLNKEPLILNYQKEYKIRTSKQTNRHSMAQGLLNIKRPKNTHEYFPSCIIYPAVVQTLKLTKEE